MRPGTRRRPLPPSKWDEAITHLIPARRLRRLRGGRPGACGGGNDAINDTNGNDTNGTDTTGGIGTTGGTGTTQTPEPGQPLFIITFEGGFASPTTFASLGPTYAVTTDGQLIFQGAIPEIFPGPLVPPYEVTDVSDLLPDLQEILDRLGIAEITDEINDQGAANVADAPPPSSRTSTRTAPTATACMPSASTLRRRRATRRWWRSTI